MDCRRGCGCSKEADYVEAMHVEPIQVVSAVMHDAIQ